MSDVKPQQQQNGSSSGGAKKIPMSELEQHKESGNLWLTVDGKVYDVSKFMDEHPGGDEVLITEGGKDATEAFEDVGHSDDARALLPPMLVGELEGAEQKVSKAKPASVDPSAVSTSNPLFMFVPLLALVAWYVYKNHLQ